MGLLRSAAVAVAAALILAAPVHAESSSGAADTPAPPAGAPMPAYQPLDTGSSVLSPSLETAADIDRFLAPTALHDMGSEFIRAEARTGVNARFLVGITWTENHAGASTLAQSQHNLFSFVGSGPGGWASYASDQESIQTAADYIGAEYARPGGRHYRGGTVADVGTVYAADPQWPDKVARSANYIGPSRGPAYAAELHLAAVTPASTTIHVVNTGYAPWDLAPDTKLVIHCRWSRQRESVTGMAIVPAPALRSGGEADLPVPGVVPPDGGGWRFTVSAELTGAGWAEDLGGAARDSQWVGPDSQLDPVGPRKLD